MNGDITESSSTIKYVAKPYKRRKSIHQGVTDSPESTSPSEPNPVLEEVVDNTKVCNGDKMNVNDLIVTMCCEDKTAEITILKDDMGRNKFRPKDNKQLNNDVINEEPIVIPDSDDSPEKDSLTVIYQKLNKPPDTAQNNLESPPRVISPISLPRTPSSVSSLSFSFVEDGKRTKSRPTSPSSGLHSLGIYAEVTEQSGKCKPQLIIVKQCLGDELKCKLLEKYHYLFTTEQPDQQETKLKEFMQDFILQQKMKSQLQKPPTEECRAKIKTTPTLNELKKAKEKSNVLNLLKRGHDITLDREASCDETESESEDEIEIIEEGDDVNFETSSTISSLRQAYEEQYRRNGYVGHSRANYTMHTYRSQVKAAYDQREHPPTMITHRGHYEGIYNYITKEHDYCCYYSRPKNIEWNCYKKVPKVHNIEMVNKQESIPTKALVSDLPRPNYVMSEPWLFVPCLDDTRSAKDCDEFQKALGFETVLRRMLQKDVPAKAINVECAICELDFSCEWFTFMSKRLCRCCYQKEVKSRNSIIYLTSMSALARQSHSSATYEK